MKYVDIRDLPPCSFSPQCLRLIDDLDAPAVTPARTGLAYIEDLQDERQLRRLRSHVPNCPTCSALLAEARRTRTQQRMMLHHFLLANERQVPSTSNAIFEALRRELGEDEANTVKNGRARAHETMLLPPLIDLEAPPTQAPLPLHPRAAHHRRLFQNMLTLATVAAVILAAVGLLNRFSGQTETSSNQPAKQTPHPTQPASVANNFGWNSVLITLTVASAAGMVKGFSFYNYDTSDSKFTNVLSSTQSYANVSAEEISSDGQKLLYETTSSDQQKTYTVFTPQTQAHPLYHLDADQGGNAIWMDATSVLVQDTTGLVLEVNTQTGATQHSWHLQTGRLAFYHQPYLYFVGANNLTAGALYRVDLSQENMTPQRITNSAPNARFWLSADGSAVFYANKGSSGTQGIYAVSSDGTNSRLLRSGPGLPIGYAEDNALMVLEQTGNKLQVIKLGTTPGAREQTVFANAAPNATSLCGPSAQAAIIQLCDRSIALAPYGHGLLLHAYYANGSHSLVYDDLDTGSSRSIYNLPAGSNVQLPGWSKWSISHATTSFAGQETLMCA